jgi:soluble lytic murein transglycosylase
LKYLSVSRFRFLLYLALLLVARIAVAAEEDPYAGVRETFRSAYGAATAGAPDAGKDDSALKRYPLYPYLRARRLETGLRAVGEGEAPVDKAVAAFLTEYGDEPVARSLRRTWLSSLASRRQWPLYLKHYDPDSKDLTQRCDAAAGQLALGGVKTLAATAEDLWLTARETPPQCEPVFDWLRAQQRLTPALIERRARLALKAGEAGLARKLAKQLPGAAAAPLNQWAALIEQPQAAIDALLATPQQPVEEDALLDGWSRLARKDPDAAAQRFDALSRVRALTPAQQASAAQTVALGFALSRRADAVEWFDRASAAVYDDRAYEWRARSAIWNGDWDHLARAITAMPEVLRAQPRWRYWAARAAAANGNALQAQVLFGELAGDDSYYAVLAAEREGRRYAPHPQTLSFDDAQVANLAKDPAFIRARELLRCDLKDEAAAEWWFGFNALPAVARMQSLALAYRWNWFDVTVAAASRLGVFNDYLLLFPRPYARDVQAATALSGLPSDLIYSVMRQESLYRSDAVSRVGALGLLQLMPETARRTALHWQRPKPTGEQLFDPAVNLPLGAAQLRQMIDAFGGQVPVALAAYNAGPNAATRWLPSRPMDADAWIENIPFNETRGYVQRILWHQLVFSWLREGHPQKVEDWLARITPVTASQEARAAPGAAVGGEP